LELKATWDLTQIFPIIPPKNLTIPFNGPTTTGNWGHRRGTTFYPKIPKLGGTTTPLGYPRTWPTRDDWGRGHDGGKPRTTGTDCTYTHLPGRRTTHYLRPVPPRRALLLWTNFFGRRLLSYRVSNKPLPLHSRNLLLGLTYLRTELHPLRTT